MSKRSWFQAIEEQILYCTCSLRLRLRDKFRAVAVEKMCMSIFTCGHLRGFCVGEKTCVSRAPYAPSRTVLPEFSECSHVDAPYLDVRPVVREPIIMTALSWENFRNFSYTLNVTYEYAIVIYFKVM